MPPTSPRHVPTNYARLIEFVRVAEALSQSRAEIVTFEQDHAYVLATLGRKVLQPRPLTASERRLLAGDFGHARAGRTVSFAARAADGRLLAALTVADDVQAIAVDGLYTIARLVAETFSESQPVMATHAADAVLSALRDPVVVIDSEFVVRFASQALTTLVGRTPIEVTGQSCLDFIHPDDLEVAAGALGRLVEGREVYRTPMRLLHGSGEYVRVEFTGNDRTSDPQINGIVLSFRSDDRDLELADELDAERGLLSAVLDQLHEGVIATDLLGVPTLVNQAARALHGLEHNTPTTSIRVPDLVFWRGANQPVGLDDHPITRVGAGEHLAAEPYSILQVDGTARHVLISGRPVVNAEGQQVASALAYHDATEALLTESDLRDRALHDPLTGLPNRRQLAERIERGHADRTEDQIALCFIDLDGFKLVNDTFGHAVGDHVLRTVAQRLSAELRPHDVLARLGGDEFVALLAGVVDRCAAGAIAERLRTVLTLPFTIDGNVVGLSASIGVAMSPPTASEAERLLNQADLAMYSAKSKGKNRIEFYFDDLADAARDQQRRIQFLKDSLDHDGVVMQYQPVVDLRTGGVIGFEAMVRCVRPDGGLASPESFLSAAPASGLLWDLDRRAFDLTCQAASEICRRYPHQQLRMGYNFGPLSLCQPDFVAEIQGTMHHRDARPGLICIEISASTAFDLAERSRIVLQELASGGVCTMLGDFGAGDSSLAQLRDLPLRAIKIDHSSTFGHRHAATGVSIAGAFVSLANTLGVAVFAEAVETAEQAEQMRGLGFRAAQGIFFAPPMSLEELHEFLSRPADVRAG
jgi:diguanylate cyclase (GGDEF)-like protein/PAS domain S-box-containing protein